MGDLRVVGDPRAAERHCEDDEDDSDMVSFTVLALFSLNQTEAV